MRRAMTDGSLGSSSGNRGRVTCFSLTYDLPSTDTSSAPPAPSRAYSAWRLVLTRVHRVPQTVTDERETEHRQGDSQRRKEPEIPVDANVLRAVGDHFTQTRRRLVDADAEEAQAGLGEDRGGDSQGDGDDGRRDGVRQEVANRDRELPRAHRPGGSDVLLLPQHQELGPHQATNRHPGGDADNEDDVPDASTEHGHQ